MQEPRNPQPQLQSIRDVAALFLRRRSPQVLVAGLVMALLARLVMTDGLRWGPWDGAAVVLVVALAPLFEWFIHLFVLHLPPTRLGPVTVDPGAGHRNHHRLPNDLDHALLQPREAVVFQVVNGAVAAAVVAVLLRGFGAVSAEPLLTGVVAAIAALTHYEWAHFIFHTTYRPRTRYYRRLKRNHRLHHHRNERYWLGITSNAGDRLFRTYASDRSSVPRSSTTRTLVE